MISIIICSVKPELLYNVTENIYASIGVPVQVIAIDNRNTDTGICKVYNEAANQAKFEILCFIHEDVILHTDNWGHKLVRLLEDEAIGLVGVSGSVYKSKYPGAWTACDQSLYRSSTIQHFKNSDKPIHNIVNPQNNRFDEVAVVDGVFLAMRKKVWELNNFNEGLLTGFHCYDIDISCRIGASKKVLVTHEIILEHLSEGSFNMDWVLSSLLIHRYWAKRLPICIGNLSSSVRTHSDYIACQSIFLSMLRNNMEKLVSFKYFLHLSCRFFTLNGFTYFKTALKFYFLGKPYKN